VATDSPKLASGPGNLTRALGITVRDNGCDLTRSRVTIEPPDAPREFVTARGTRIGITKAVDLPLRVLDRGEPLGVAAQRRRRSPSGSNSSSDSPRLTSTDFTLMTNSSRLSAKKLLAKREEDAVAEGTVLGQREIDDALARSDLLAGDHAHDAVVGIEPDGRHLTVVGCGPDHGHGPPPISRDVTDVGPDAPRLPLGEQIVDATLERRDELRPLTLG